MKIAQVNLQRDYGGAEIHVRMLARGLRARGHETQVWCHPTGRLRQEVEKDGARTEPLLVRSQLTLGATLRLAARLRRDRPEVLHLHTPKDYLCGLMAGRLAQIPAIVLTRHMLLPLKPLMRRVYAHADAVVCLSWGLQSLLHSQGVPAEKLRLIYGAIDTAPFDVPAEPSADSASALALRREWHGDTNVLLVGCVGRLVAGKGQATLLEAVAECHVRCSGVPGFGYSGVQAEAVQEERTCEAPIKLILIGEGPERNALEVQAAKLGITDSVCFAGFRSDIPRVLAALDIVAVPSTGVELLPLTIMEAMAASRPVIATQVGGVPEIIVNESMGMLVPPGDANALSTALSRLAAAPTLRRKMGETGAARIRAAFAFPRLLDNTEELYAGLVGIRC